MKICYKLLKKQTKKQKTKFTLFYILKALHKKQLYLLLNTENFRISESTSFS